MVRAVSDTVIAVSDHILQQDDRVHTSGHQGTWCQEQVVLQVEQTEAAAHDMQAARDEAARSISDSMLQQEAAMKQAQQARDAASQAQHQLQKAQHAQQAAEQQRYAILHHQVCCTLQRGGCRACTGTFLSTSASADDCDCSITSAAVLKLVDLKGTSPCAMLRN